MRENRTNRGMVVFLLVVSIVSLALAGVTFWVVNELRSVDHETVYQVSTIDALMMKAYTGVVPVSKLLSHGDIGIGTFDGIDGELIILDGRCYQARTDGNLYPVPPDAMVPYADVTFFEPDLVFTIGPTDNIGAMSGEIDHNLPSPNLFYAIRADGSFPIVKFRSIPRQEAPYNKTLAEAAGEQAVHELQNVSGTLIGFYSPPYVQGIGIPGFHFHFVTGDRRMGGHVLDLVTGPATKVKADITPGFTMELPLAGEFIVAPLGTDLSSDIARVER